MWNRWQDPETGRFLGEDPARDGENWYSYVGNNPINRRDPTGLKQIIDGDSSTGLVVDNGNGAQTNTKTGKTTDGGSGTKKSAGPPPPSPEDIANMGLGLLNDALRNWQLAALRNQRGARDPLTWAASGLNLLAATTLDAVIGDDLAEVKDDFGVAASTLGLGLVGRLPAKLARSGEKLAAKEAEQVVEDGSKAFTKSNLKLGQEVHKGYKADLHDPDNGQFKEYTGIKGIRPDFVDFKTRTIFELKPNNPRAEAAGNRQLATYKAAFEAKFGGEWKTKLDKY